MKENYVYFGDNVELLKQIEEDSVDLTVTSPPYDKLREYKNGLSWDFEGVANQLYRVTKFGGVVVWVVSDSSIGGGESLSSFKQAIRFSEIGFTLNDTMIYLKPNRRPRQYRAKRYEQIFEYMFVFSKGQPKTFNPILEDCLNKGKTIHFTSRDATKENNFTAGDVITNRGKVVINDKKRKGNVWLYTNNSIGINHPAIFPEDLARDHILSWSNVGDLVLDPFVGSGTTCKIAKDLNRKYIGFDNVNEYVEMSNIRLSE